MEWIEIPVFISLKKIKTAGKLSPKCFIYATLSPIIKIKNGYFTLVEP
ncbi:hypothetical protein CLOSBL3_20542 [Clostridiaceae bacterium BL-3]|nr:hypothetical protein CLOSBL3_20542 [Clostridiaceae bacterium BL-3]